MAPQFQITHGLCAHMVVQFFYNPTTQLTVVCVYVCVYLFLPWVFSDRKGFPKDTHPSAGATHCLMPSVDDELCSQDFLLCPSLHNEEAAEWTSFLTVPVNYSG